MRADAVDWSLADSVARRLAARAPLPPVPGPSDAELADLATRAESMVEAATGLRAPSPAHLRVLDRPAWASANVASFRGLLTPLTQRFEERAARQRETTIGRASFGIGRSLTGLELGTVLGWMARRVLGQYDLLVTGGDAEGRATGAHAHDPDAVYVVGPNIAAVEHRFGFPPGEFRLWVTLHELTHRAQFTGVPWMRGHYLGLIHRILSVDPDPARLLTALVDAARNPAERRARLDQGGIAALVATPEQRAALQEMAGLMALLEGHGDVTMNRAGAGAIPSAARFAHVLEERRNARSPMTRSVQRALGVEAKLRQYRAGEAFIAAVEGVGGPEVLERCWAGPEGLPTWDEIQDPRRWLERVGAGGRTG